VSKITSIALSTFLAIDRPLGEFHLLPFAVAIFSSAFLVFQVQPLIARFILPWYGGTPGVWTICMLFFQLGLLAGYLYAHAFAKRLPLRHQVIVHGGLLVLSLLSLPIAPALPEFPSSLPQTLEILYVLMVSVSFPFVLLSASAPLVQHWFARVHPGRSPFRLYALSNVGSLLALLSYPFLVEPALKLTTQTWIWSCAYVAFMGLTPWCAWPVLARTLQQDPTPPTGEETARPKRPPRFTPVQKPTWFDRMSWLLPAALGSVVLLAVTNQMCQDVAVIPFLWIAPLSLYLITFIVCFERAVWYQRKIWLPFLALSVGFLVYLLRRDYADTELSLAYQIVIYCAALFGCCMVCHGEMVRRRPAVGDLTTFYVYVALGGALGGVFVNLIAPLVFDGFWELHGSLVFVCLFATVCVALDRNALSVVPRRVVVTVGCAGVVLLVWCLGMHISEQRESSILNTRSFFGVLYVYEYDQGTRQHARSLYHGRIRHGKQWLHGSEVHRPISYYGPRSGVALALDHFPSRKHEETEKSAIRVGAIGLGVGTIAAYGRPRDVLRFYEINADVESVAREYFRYLDNSSADIDVVIGDGRRMMQRELETRGSQQYDVIVVDAFSGDAIPIHLLTKEASDIYWQHLHENGILALHITNLHVDLSDVVRHMAIHADKEAIYIEDEGRGDGYSQSSWVLITSNQTFLNDHTVRSAQDDWPHELKPIVWTDDFSNLFEVVKW
jgi:hypothetical protein